MNVIEEHKDAPDLGSAVIYRIDPLQDPRWSDFISKHPQSSIFHTPGWLAALRNTYSYEPIVFTMSPTNTPLTNGIVFCHVNSWVTGSRLVSTPFADHCQPLASNPGELQTLLQLLPGCLRELRCKYIELRPLTTECDTFCFPNNFVHSASFEHHLLQLSASLDDLFRNFHRSCIQRKVRRASREQLRYKEDRSDTAINQFYSLLVKTRRRHGSLPQPISWFRNLFSSLGNILTLRLIYRQRRVIAGVITFQHKNTITYKYGCSDAEFHNLGAMPFMFWNIICDGKSSGAESLDLGRSDLHDLGLIGFKNHLGATSQQLRYYRHPAGRTDDLKGFYQTAAKYRLSAHLPDILSRALGSLLYRHIG